MHKKSTSNISVMAFLVTAFLFGICSAAFAQVNRMAIGANHILAVTAHGTVVASGDNTYGELGPSVPGNTNKSLVTVDVAGLSNIVAVAAGEFHSVALRSDGTVWTWGRNNAGQLGHITGTPVAKTNAYPVPQLVEGLPSPQTE